MKQGGPLPAKPTCAAGNFFFKLSFLICNLETGRRIFFLFQGVLFTLKADYS